MNKELKKQKLFERKKNNAFQDIYWPFCFYGSFIYILSTSI